MLVRGELRCCLKAERLGTDKIASPSLRPCIFALNFA